jgi:teichuronic acid biosynthesis glycosyltransferase TuaH
MKYKTALIFGVKQPWDMSTLPALFLAKYLSEKGVKVSYIADDLSIFHLAKWKLNKETLKSATQILTKGYYNENMKAFASFSLFPHFDNINKLYSFLCSQLNIQIRSKSMKAILKSQYDLAFSSSLRNFDLFSNCNASRKIFSIEDNPYGFGILSDNLIKQAEEYLQSSSQIETWCTSHQLIEDKYPFARYYSNGINDNFEIELKHNKNKKCVYLGAIEEWFDWDLVNKAFHYLGENNGYSLDIYGFCRSNPNEFIKTPSITYKGSIKNSEAQHILQNYSVGIIPFKNNDLIKYVNPIKYYEYLSCGLRTVAISWSELEKLNYQYMYLANAENFADVIIQANDNDYRDHELQIKIFLENKKYSNIFSDMIHNG